MTIKISELRASILMNHAAGVPVMVKGASGVGKTEIAEQVAMSKGPDHGLFELNCATASLPDVIGLQMPHTEHYQIGDKPFDLVSSQFAYPYFMRDKRSQKPAFLFKSGTLVLEEWGQAGSDVKRALAQVIRELRAGGYTFPGDTQVLLLSNRPEDRSGVTKEFDFLINRWCELNVLAEADGWIVWANDNGVTNMSMAFAMRNTDKVFSNKAPEKQGPWLTPRSLVSADHFISKAMEGGWKLDDPLMRENLGGIIGEGYAHLYIAFAKIRDKLPRYADIIKDPEGTAVPEEPDQQMFLVFDLASKVDRATTKAIVTYIERMPTDFSVAFYRSALQRSPDLRSTKEFGDWAVKNVQLLSALARS